MGERDRHAWCRSVASEFPDGELCSLGPILVSVSYPCLSRMNGVPMIRWLASLHGLLLAVLFCLPWMTISCPGPQGRKPGENESTLRGYQLAISNEDISRMNVEKDVSSIEKMVRGSGEPAGGWIR